MLDINKMMNEEVKKELNKVVINGVLVGEFNDDVVTKVMNILKGKTTKVSAPSTIEEDKKKESNYDIACKGEGQFWKSDLVVVTLEDGKYRARFNYRLIKGMSKDKETHKYSPRKYEFMKELFKKQLTELGAKWVSNDDEVDFGWYEFPTKKSAEEYRKIRKADDKKYEKKA